MVREIICCNYVLATGVVADVFLNDLPFDDHLLRGQRASNEPINHMLVPGDNELSLRILRAPLDEPGCVQVAFFKPSAGATDPSDVQIIHRVSFPELFAELPEERRRLPLHHLAHFDAGADVHRPAYLANPPETFPDDGSRELREAVQDLHDALQARDATRYMDLTHLRMREQASAYEGHPEKSVAAQRTTFEQFFAREIRVKPLDLNDLHFEPRAGGRVAYVRRIDGKRALVAAATDGSDMSLSAKLIFTKHAGRWQLC